MQPYLGRRVLISLRKETLTLDQRDPRGSLRWGGALLCVEGPQRPRAWAPANAAVLDESGVDHGSITHEWTVDDRWWIPDGSWMDG